MHSIVHHPPDVPTDEVSPLVGYERVDEGLVDDSVAGDVVCRDRFEDADSLIQVFEDTTVGVDEGRDVGTVDLDGGVSLEVLKHGFHRCDIDRLNRSIDVQKQLKMQQN